MLTLKIKNKIREFAKEAGREALKSQINLEVFEKEDGVDLATHMDRKIERDFYELTSKLTPNYGFLGEEFKELEKEAEFVWTIDPIDGTKYYAKQIPLWAVSIALMQNEEPIYGVIYYASMDQLFEAEVGKGATLNGDKIESSSVKSADQVQISWDCSPLNKLDPKTRKIVLEDLARYQKEFYRVRNYGIATLSICWIVTGYLGAFINYETSKKDIVDSAAGVIIAKEGGLKVLREKFEKYNILKISQKNLDL